MGGCSSRFQAAPPPVPEDEEDTPRVVLQVTDNPEVEEDIQRALADEKATTLRIWARNADTPLTVNDARRIIACLENPRFDTLHIFRYDIHDDAVLNVFRDGLPLCTAIKTVSLWRTKLGNEDLDRLRPAFYNTSVRKLDISNNNIQGRRGGEVLRDLLRGNNTLVELILFRNCIGPEGSIGLGQGCADNNHLQKLNLCGCIIGNNGLANLLVSMGKANNNSLTNLSLGWNGIEGADGGQKLTLLLQCFPALIVLNLDYNNLGPLGAHALAPGLAAASHLEELVVARCRLGNDGVANLFPRGHENRSLTNLSLDNNDLEGTDGGRQVTLLLQHFPALKVLDLSLNNLGRLGACASAPGLVGASHLESLVLRFCGLGNDGVANLIPDDDQVNTSLTNLNLDGNNIEGVDGGRQVTLLLQRFPALKVLFLSNNLLGPLGAHELAPGLAAAIHLESLELPNCGLGNDGVANLVPGGHVNSSLINLDVGGSHDLVGGEIAIALASRCTNLNRLNASLNRDQHRRLDLLLDRKRLCTEASALAGSAFSVLFRFVENAHRHEHGLSAIFVILQNDGDDYFCTALNRAIE